MPVAARRRRASMVRDAPVIRIAQAETANDTSSLLNEISCLVKNLPGSRLDNRPFAT
jgi:hypothetical protein